MLKKIKCIIVEDEPLAINIIKKYLQEFRNFELINTFSNAIDALSYLRDHKVDVIFLDINMPLLDGLSFIKSLDEKPIIVITSAYKEYAIETYSLDVIDYLLKPIEFSRFVKTTNKISSQLPSIEIREEIFNNRPYIFVKIDKKTLQKIFLDEILVVECLKDYLKIKTLSGKYIIHQTLSSFTSQLPSTFIRIHRSYTVAVDKINIIEGNSLEVDSMRYPIGRTYVEHVKQSIVNSGKLIKS